MTDRQDDQENADAQPPADDVARSDRADADAIDQDDPSTFERAADKGLLDPLLSADGGVLEGLRATDEHPIAATGEIDPWAHRRGEPRMFALLWSVYLFGAALSTVMRIPVLGMSETRFVQEKARVLLLLIAVGLMLLWPMVRLSQARPRKPVVAALVDLFALLAPAQAVIWPLKWLGDWGWDVIAGLNLMLVSWAVLVGVLLAIGTGKPTGLARTVWMAMIVVLVCGAPVVTAIAGMSRVVTPEELALASPLTSIYALTTAPSGLRPSMSTSTWIAASIPALLALPFWALVPLHAKLQRPGARSTTATLA